MKEDLYDDLFDEKEEKTDFQALFFKYVIHWPWFIASILICMALAFIYLRYQAPVYEVASSVLIKEDDNKKSANNALAAMQDFGMFSMTSNFDNEVEILKSRTLIKKVVSHLNLYINIAQKQPFGYDIPLYKDTPFDVFMTAEEADKLDENILLDLTYDTLGKLSAEVSYTQDNEKQKAQKSFDKLPAILPLPIGVITISGRDSLSIPTEPIKLKESNPAIINLNTGIEAMRHNVKTTVNSVLKGLQITRNNIDRQSRKYESRISNAPKQEQEFMTISRQQEIKATLYIMLLQKREENAITLAATANNGRIIEEPIPGGIVSPKGKLIYIIALVIGIGIPISIIYLLNLLRFRIEGHTDVEKLTTVPIIGDIPLTDAGKNGTPTIAVRENDNNIMAETFRSLRTNLLFIMGDPDKKVILVTSTISGEGKTFMASNLAVSLALLGKKVILVGLDIRKPGLNKIFHLSHKEKGITQYLAAPQSTDLHALIQPSGITSNLDLLLGGPIPPNPTELLARQSLEDTISTLRKEYDYIVLDTAPIGMVTDTLILSRVADASIYVCRADYTHKTDYQLINELQEHHRLPNLCTVVNGIDMKKKKYGYYYGYGKYGKYYGYGKKYGYS